MKNTRAVVMIVVSVIIALAAVLLASNWIRQQGSMSTGKVVVASKDLSLGTRLTPESLTLVDWPKGSIPPGAMQGEEALGKLLKDPEKRACPNFCVNGFSFNSGRGAPRTGW